MQEEDSNSQNGNINQRNPENEEIGFGDEALTETLTIQSVEKLKGAKREEVKVYLSDGSFFYLSIDLLYQTDLHEGSVLTGEAIARLTAQSEQLAIKRKALELLASARHTRAGLRLKLLKKDFKPSLVDAVLDELTELGLIDDAAFAREWLQFRLKKHPEGKQALLAGLMKKGIERSLAEECIKESIEPATELDNAVRALVKLDRLRRADEKKAIASLSARGFSYELIKKALKKVTGGDGGEDSFDDS